MNTELSRCIRGDSAPCTCACPFGLEVREFITKLQRGNFDAAFKVYRNAVVFPEIVSHLCPAPCKESCVLQKGAGAIELPALEAATLRWARNIDPIAFNIPAKQKSAAIIGAGLAGLTCALRLAARGYQITVFEKQDEVGGALKGRLPEEVYLNDIHLQFKYTEYKLVLNREIRSLEEIEAGAIYIATGAGGDDFGLAAGTDPSTCETSRPGIFLGGEILGGGPIEAILAGIRAARGIERYLITGNMQRDTEGAPEIAHQTKLRAEFFNTAGEAPTVAADGCGYTKDEAKTEAGRCLRCDCERCLSRCDMMEYFRVQPKVLKERVENTFIKGGAIMTGNSKRLIDACNMCSACAERCPEGIDIGEFLLQSRRMLHREEDMPLAWHEFWVRDMVFSSGEEAALCRSAPGGGENRYMYFPGCQLGASDPRYVMESYRWILSHEPHTALLLTCCGAPADWAGREKEHASRISVIRSQWEELGRPVAVFACPSCRKELQRYIPEMPGFSVYELMAPWGAPEAAEAKTVAVFDPCSSRRVPEMQQGVRALLKGADFITEELPASGAEALCCGWGGNVAASNPGYVMKVVQKRISQSETPYACYCTNCRDSFAAAGKEAFHVFDLLFGLNGSERRPPDVSRRRENRRELRQSLLKEFWNIVTEREIPVKLHIGCELAERLDRELILEDDIRMVIESCEKSGKKLYDTENNSFIGHLVIGPVTYWVEYRPCSDGWEIRNAYSHRLVVQEKDKRAREA